MADAGVEVAQGTPSRASGIFGARHTASCRFTGTGSEYFRIWIVNLLLTLITLGVYSAWAKVRKAQYFRNNTQLDGHVFGYHGRAAAILRGRIIALVLFTLYSQGFAFSRTAEIFTMALLTAIGPWLFMRGQQFALANTSYRGLRFNFRTDPTQAYRRMLPVLAVWWAPGVMSLMGYDLGRLSSLVLPATWPWMHHQLKAYQHGHATYADRKFEFAPALARFYAVYAKGAGLIFLTMLGAGFLVVTLYQANGMASLFMMSLLIAAGFAVIFYVVVSPYYAARLQQIIWSHTELGDIRFRMEMRASTLYGLAVKNTALTLMTGGLYWPWAAVALARYQLSCLQVESERSLAVLAAAVHTPNVDATGDAALDAFGLDIGL